jgi:hypothetical protein
LEADREKELVDEMTRKIKDESRESSGPEWLLEKPGEVVEYGSKAVEEKVMAGMEDIIGGSGQYWGPGRGY